MARAMKDSGIEWIGEIPEDWLISKVARFCSVQLGKMLQPLKESEEDTFDFYLSALNVGGNKLKPDIQKQMWFHREEKDNLTIKKGDLLVVEGGDIASCDIVPYDMPNVFFQNSLHRVRGKGAFDIRLLKYILWMAKSRGYIDLICNKATIAHFSKDKFLSMPLLYPPLPEQRRIADFLDAKCAEIDRVVAETEKTIEEYKTLKQSVITEAVTKGVRGDRPMKDSGIEWIGEIPEEWEIKRVKYLSRSVTKGSGITKDDVVENGDTPCVRYGEIYSKYSDYFTECVSATNVDKVEAPTYFSYGDILFTCTGELIEEIGKNVVYLGKDKCLAGGDIIVLKHEQDPLYFSYLLNSTICQIQKSSGKIKLKVVHISAGEICNMVVPIPQIEEQKEIAAYIRKKVKSIDAAIAAKQKLLAEMETYKKSVIYEYVTGKKEVV